MQIYRHVNTFFGRYISDTPLTTTVCARDPEMCGGGSTQCTVKGKWLSDLCFRDRVVRQRSFYTLLSGWQLPCQSACCQDKSMPFRSDVGATVDLSPSFSSCGRLRVLTVQSN